MTRSARPRCIVSVDLEEWCDARVAGIPAVRRDAHPPSLGFAVARLLEIFERTGARATFFVLGRVAKRYPDLVSCIADAHEIAMPGSSRTFIFILGRSRGRKGSGSTRSARR